MYTSDQKKYTTGKSKPSNIIVVEWQLDCLLFAQESKKLFLTLLCVTFLDTNLSIFSTNSTHDNK